MKKCVNNQNFTDNVLNKYWLPIITFLEYSVGFFILKKCYLMKITFLSHESFHRFSNYKVIVVWTVQQNLTTDKISSERF